MNNWYYGGFGQEFSVLDSSTWPVLQSGMKDANVRFMQEKLMALGYPFPRYGADGDYGNETYNAVIQYQKINNLPMTGSFASTDWNLLLKGNPKKYTSGQVTSTTVQTTQTGGSPLLKAFLANKFVTKKNAMIAAAVLGGLILAYFMTKKSSTVSGVPVKQNPCGKKVKKNPDMQSLGEKFLKMESKKVQEIMNDFHDDFGQEVIKVLRKVMPKRKIADYHNLSDKEQQKIDDFTIKILKERRTYDAHRNDCVIDQNDIKDFFERNAHFYATAYKNNDYYQALARYFNQDYPEIVNYLDKVWKKNPTASPKYWSRYVQPRWHSPRGLFASASAGEIAREVIKSHSDLRSAVGSLNFYINRAGANLSGERRKVIEDAKEMVRKYYTKPLAYEMAA